MMLLATCLHMLPWGGMLTAVSAPHRGQSLIGKVVAALHTRSRTRTGQRSRLASAVTEHAYAFAALAAVDYGIFHLSFAAGWIAVGVSLFLADFEIRG